MLWVLKRTVSLRGLRRSRVFEFVSDCLRCEVITGPAMFIKNSLLFISTAIDLFISLGKDIPGKLSSHRSQNMSEFVPKYVKQF